MTSGGAAPDEAVTRDALLAALADDRIRTEARIAALTRDVERIVADAALTPPDDEHDPDGATVGFERAQASHLLADARRHHDDLARAEVRTAAEGPPACDVCGTRIPTERLLARPTTRVCVVHAP